MVPSRIIAYRTRRHGYNYGNFTNVCANSFSGSWTRNDTQTALRRDVGTPATDEFKRTRHNYTAAAGTTLNHTRHTPLTTVNTCITRAHAASTSSLRAQSGCAQHLATKHMHTEQKRAVPHRLLLPTSALDEYAASTCARTHPHVSRTQSWAMCTDYAAHMYRSVHTFRSHPVKLPAAI